MPKLFQSKAQRFGEQSHREGDDAEARPILVSGGGLHVDTIFWEVVRDVSIVLEREMNLIHRLVQPKARIVWGERLRGEVADGLREALRVEHEMLLLAVHVLLIAVLITLMRHLRSGRR